MTYEEDRARAERLVDKAIRLLNNKPAGHPMPCAILFAPQEMTQVAPDHPFAVYEDSVLFQLLQVSGFSDVEINGLAGLLNDVRPDEVPVVVATRPGALFYMTAKLGGLTVSTKGIA
jgi:hypothetical protein